MRKRRYLLLLLFFGPVLPLAGFAMPETALTHTHLMKDIEKHTVTLGMGIEFYSEKPEPLYSGDLL